MIRKFLNSPGRWVALPIFAASLALGAVACDNGGTPDAGEPEPAPEPAPEPEDAGQPPIDAGQPEDAGPPPVDAGPIDGGQPEPPIDAGIPPVLVDVVRVEGQIKSAEYVDNYYLGEAVVVAKNIEGQPTANPSIAVTGDWYLDAIPPATNLKITVRSGGVSAAYQTQQAKFIPADDAIYTYNPYAAPPGWLEEVAVACAAPITPGVGGNPSADFLTFATIVGTLKDVAGNPVAGVTKAQVQVEMQGAAGVYVNNNALNVCFLQSDGGAPAKYVGGAYPTSDASGKFVVFGVKNAAAGNGIGVATISALYNGVTFTNTIDLSSGVAYLDALAGDVVPVIDQLVDFETQIIPILAGAQCNACHTAGGTGAVDRGGYLAIFDGAPSDIYDNIVGPGTQCAVGTTYRICGNDPLASYMITKPLLDVGLPNHPNETWFSVNEPDVVTIRSWIEQGYPRYAVPPDPPVINATFADVMTTLGSGLEGGANCTDCHGYNTGYSAGLSLDGCVDDAIIQTAYTAAGVVYDPVDNPDYYNEDCAYYHVALRESNHYANGGDAYYTDAAPYSVINTTNPNRSLLFQKPRCSPGVPGVCADYPLAHGGNPNVPTFDLETDARPAVLIDWIGNGSGYSRVGGPNDGT